MQSPEEMWALKDPFEFGVYGEKGMQHFIKI